MRPRYKCTRCKKVLRQKDRHVNHVADHLYWLIFKAKKQAMGVE